MPFSDAIRIGAAGAGDYEIERSLRFNDNDNAHLSRTPSGSGNRKTWTISAWVKRGNLAGNTQVLFNAHDGSASRRFQLAFNTDNKLLYNQGGDGSSGVGTSDMLFRDVSAWYHLVFRADYTNGTAGDRLKVYVNGSQIDMTFSDDVENADGQWNKTSQEHEIGVIGNTNEPFDGYMTEIHFIDGTALTPSSFGETDVVTNEWKPKKYAGSYGTNGFYVNFSDNSGTTATTLGKDSSGEGNNWTPTNFSVAAGEGNDSLEDTPTNNFCTMNRLVPSPSTTWANGNLDLGGSSSSEYNQTNTSTFGVSSGKWYAEVKVTYSTTNVYVGICPIATSATTNLTNNVTDGAVLRMDNTLFIEGSSPSSGTSISSGNIIGIALDMDNQKVWFSVQGTYLSSGNPATGANATFDGITAGETIAICARPLNGTLNFNFGQRAFSYTPPTGFKTLCSANFSDPSIKLPDKHFEALIWTGNSTDNRAITGLNFQPDFTWIKNRSSTMTHFVVNALLSNTDSGGGNGNEGPLATNATGSASALTDGGFESFNSDGFTLGKGSSTSNADAPYQKNNASGETYVGWSWKGSSSTVANGDGSTSAQVRANASAGFSILTYTGTGSNATVGHGLGVAPKCFIVKRTDAAGDWAVYHYEMGTHGMQLNSNGAQASEPWWNGHPTSSVINLKTSATVNGSSNTYVAFVFSEVAGYSKFGSYVGNGNSDGTFVFTGFKPALIISKKYSGTDSWQLWDNKRDPDNLMHHRLFGNENSPETTSVNSSSSQLDFYSNGFKWRGSSNDTNGSGDDYLYLAFAESPFKYARAR